MSTPSLPLGGSHIGGTIASSEAVPLLLEPQLASLDMINSCNVFYSARQGTLDFLKGKGQGKSCTCIRYLLPLPLCCKHIAYLVALFPSLRKIIFKGRIYYIHTYHYWEIGWNDFLNSNLQ